MNSIFKGTVHPKMVTVDLTTILFIQVKGKQFLRVNYSFNWNYSCYFSHETF